jgi:uncharacterized protein YecA (UPF0149 family)
MQDLACLDPSRWCALNYAEFIADTTLVVERLCHFMEVPVDEALRAHCSRALPNSRYTLSPPAADKWRRHAHELAPEMPAVIEMCEQINEFVLGASLPLATDLSIDLTAMPTQGKLSRNEPCSCGSKKKYKHCHGRL